MYINRIVYIQNMSENATNKLVFFPSGRLGNAFFRYMACAVVNIINPALEYTLLADFRPPVQKFTYYPGLDQEGQDLYHGTCDLAAEAEKNDAVLGYNTLGFFKHTIDQLSSNKYINKDNGQGLYVKKTLTLTDTNFFNHFYKKLENFNVCLDGYFQFGYIYLKYKPQILNYMETHKAKHAILTDRNERFLLRELIDDVVLPTRYDIAIHIRLDDFKGRPDFIEVEHYIRVFETLLPVLKEQKICLVYQAGNNPMDTDYIATCVQWFRDHAIPLCLESNTVLHDFNILKQAKILVCSMSTLSWAAAYLSKDIQQCYMPDYHFYTEPARRAFFFHKPIENTSLYQVKTTPAQKIKTYLITLPAYAERLATLDSLNHQLALIGLDATLYQGVHGKDIFIYEAASKVTHIKHILWENTTYFYDTRVRLNGQPMTKGEFGCAWSHLNLLRQFVAEPVSANYYLILEDDVELVKPVGELEELLRNIPADADMCHLAKSDWYPFVRTQPANAYFYECEKRFFNKTTAYVVSLKGAQKILDYTPHSINVPVDDLYNMIFRLTPDFRFYVPATYFFQEQAAAVSTIHAIDA
ncbi:MAG: hypothetical protein EBT78_17180 [Betaproteobacteria bacterium]|nr:hypothetical protein [Betaproteobacteria bacterium]